MFNIEGLEVFLTVLALISIAPESTLTQLLASHSCMVRSPL
jgi:hypothetical protein